MRWLLKSHAARNDGGGACGTPAASGKPAGHTYVARNGRTQHGGPRAACRMHAFPSALRWRWQAAGGGRFFFTDRSDETTALQFR